MPHHLRGVLPLLALAATVGLIRAATLRGVPLERRLQAATLPPLITVLGLWLWLRWTVRPIIGPWSAARLAPAAALLQGYRLYDLPGQGPVSGWIYPPVSALCYLPAAILAEPPCSVLIGRMLSGLFVLGPAAWLLSAPGYRTARGPLLVAFGFLITTSRALSYVTTEILADAPALGWGTLALGLASQRRTLQSSALAGIAAALAVWSKQLAASIVIVVLATLAIDRGRKIRPGPPILAGGILAGLSLIFFAWFGPREVFLNIWTVPSRHAWRESGLNALLRVALEAAAKHKVLLGLLGVSLLGAFAAARGRDKIDRGQADSERNPWPFLVAGVVSIPLALMGFLKVGGDDNSLASSLAYLALAAVLFLGTVLARWPRAGCALIAFNLAMGWQTLTWIDQTLQRRAPDWSDDQTPGMSWWDEEVLVLRYLRAHPGTAYFPCNPLEHLSVEGRLPHFEYGVWDRDAARLPVSPEQLRSHIPKVPRYVCYPAARSYTGHSVLRSLPEFRLPVSLPELPGCLCVERPGDDPGASSSKQARSSAAAADQVN